MNSTNSSMNTKPFSRNGGRFIIKKNTPPIETKKTLTGPSQLTLKNTIKPKTETPFQLTAENTISFQPKSSNIFEKAQPALVKRDSDTKKYMAKAENDLETLAPKSEYNMDNYVDKILYEDLRKKYEQLNRKHDELKLKHRNLERDCQHKNRKNTELYEENERLKERLEELENENRVLRNTQQKRQQPNQPMFVEEEEEEAKMGDDELRSLHLAMRYEAENLLMSRLSQLAALQVLYDRSVPANRNDLDNPENINPDNMTYEELLQLEERMGKVSRGLQIEQIKKIPKKVCQKKPNQPEETCSICFMEVEEGAKIRTLSCCHEYHSKCIKQWLLNEKSCPICKKEVIVPEQS